MLNMTGCKGMLLKLFSLDNFRSHHVDDDGCMYNIVIRVYSHTALTLSRCVLLQQALTQHVCIMWCQWL